MNKLLKNLKLAFQKIIINILINIILKLYNFQFKNIKILPKNNCYYFITSYDEFFLNL